MAFFKQHTLYIRIAWENCHFQYCCSCCYCFRDSKTHFQILHRPIHSLLNSLNLCDFSELLFVLLLQTKWLTKPVIRTGTWRFSANHSMRFHRKYLVPYIFTNNPFLATIKQVSHYLPIHSYRTSIYGMQYVFLKNLKEFTKLFIFCWIWREEGLVDQARHDEVASSSPKASFHSTSCTAASCRIHGICSYGKEQKLLW